ncbi:hypothetical protein CMI38_02610 [Candidatus Pacearchaeota archaeon]|jgi:hypothetical protein|nr:hypothetical protein [Candidatus Pacearchaeota archaeon]|tara:strand:- start:21982 stop:22284 length:303 start_codon:yes stop_codon:yes gene_type:complete
MRDDIIFEVEDKTNRKIRLTKTQWEHITITHQDMNKYLNEIKETVEDPIKTLPHESSEELKKYFTYLKHREHPNRYLRVIIKYLNGDGFIITAHFTRTIK